MTDEEMAAFVGRYYARAVRREPDAEQMAFFRKTVQSGPHGLLIPRTMLAGTDPMIINVALMPNLRNEE